MVPRPQVAGRRVPRARRADLNFFPVYGRLAEAYRVIAPDLRGHGRGMRSTEPFTLEGCADDAAALLGQVGADRVIAVGTRWAARSGCGLRQAAEEQPELEAWRLITTRDRLVRPAEQRELARALNADEIEIEADHDLPLVKGAEYAQLSGFAVDTVAATAGLKTAARHRG